MGLTNAERRNAGGPPAPDAAVAAAVGCGPGRAPDPAGRVRGLASRGRKFALPKTQVRLAQAAMAHRDTSVSALCRELGIRPVTLYRYVGPQGGGP